MIVVLGLVHWKLSLVGFDRQANRARATSRGILVHDGFRGLLGQRGASSEPLNVSRKSDHKKVSEKR